MPPKVKFQKEEIVAAALQIAREKGIDAVTAREVGARLNVSARPIFTWYDSMDQLKRDVYEQAKVLYKEYIERGLSEPIPFLGVWHQYIAFAKEEPELYRLLFLKKPDGVTGGAEEALRFLQDLARESLMRIYHLDAFQADCYFRDVWLIAFSYATLIVTDDCPFPEEEMFAVGAEVSLAIFKAYKEIPGLPEGNYDRDALFS
ncbi:MAG: TetR/AcrR family transcriptional regulator, partial [Clostridia bacterium]|nr:TetR/AcrR family transcriptional regulator [Clostridia bacterium]